MQIKLFTIPITAVSDFNEEINVFLRSNNTNYDLILNHQLLTNVFKFPSLPHLRVQGGVRLGVVFLDFELV